MTALIAPRSLALRRETLRQMAAFGSIGIASTAAYVVLYAWLRQGMSAGAANAVALLITAVANTAANRRLTFEVRGRSGLARDHAAGLLAFVVALAITSASLALLDAATPIHSRAVELAVLAAANAGATLARFLLLRIALRAGHPSVPVPASQPR